LTGRFCWMVPKLRRTCAEAWGIFTSGAEARLFPGLGGTAEAVPSRKLYLEAGFFCGFIGTAEAMPSQLTL
jgi:hypothetical protein